MAYWCLQEVDYDCLDYVTNRKIDGTLDQVRRSGGLAAVSVGSHSSPASPRSSTDANNAASPTDTSNDLSSSFSTRTPPCSPRSVDALTPMTSPLSSPRDHTTFTPPSSPRDEDFISSPRMRSPLPGSKSGYVKFVIPKPVPVESVTLSPQELEDGAVNRLRMAMVCRETQKHIPRIVAEWPCTCLRLSRILSPEACMKVFTFTDHLWTHLLHGLLIQTPACRLRCLDLTDFIPSKAMLYTMLQLVPLLSYAGVLDNKSILQHIISTHGVDDPNLIDNLRQFLDTILCHSVYTRGRKLHHQGPLEIIIDYLPLAADKLSFYCWMMSSSLYDSTRVYIRINTVVFNYTAAGSEFRPIDPLLPLKIFVDSAGVQDLQGLSVSDVPTGSMHTLFSGALAKCTERGYKLNRLAISRLATSVDFTQIQLKSQFSAIMSKCSALTRLDISGSCVPGLLGDALRSTSLQLEYLNLSHACLDNDDLQVVLNSKCATSLRELNISYIYSSHCCLCCSPDEKAPGDDNNNSESLKPELLLEENGLSDSSLINRAHIADIDLLRVAFRNLHTLQKLNVFYFESDRFGSDRIDKTSLDILLCAIKSLPLGRLNMQRVPLWDDDIINVVKVLSNIHTVCLVTLSRSTEAPKLSTEDAFIFWTKVQNAKNGNEIHVTVDNLVESLYRLSLDNSSDSDMNDSDT